MSIKNAADLVRSQGRYGDTALMHVNPQEIAALQTIAQKHGKSLSVNPETGLLILALSFLHWRVLPLAPWSVCLGWVLLLAV